MKKYVALLGILLLAFTASAALADSTIGNLQPGGMVQTSDYFPAARAGCVTEGDCKVQFGSAASQTIGTSGATLGLLNTSNTYSALQSFLSGDFTAADATFTGDSILLPSGTTSQRPGSPANGMMRYNTSLTAMEAYVGGAWGPIGGGSGSGTPGGSTGSLQVNGGSGSFSAYGGLTCGSHKWMNALDAAGTLSTDCVQPGFGDLSGVATNSQIPAPTTVGLGGILGLASSTVHNVVQYIDTSGIQHLAQVAFSDLSGALSYSQMPNSGATAGSYTSANITINAEGIVTAAANGTGGGGSVSVTAASSNVVISPSPGTGTFTVDLGSAPSVSGAVTGLDFVSSGTGANVLPVGTTSQRPGSPAAGMIRYNSTATPSVEAYVNGSWASLTGTPNTSYSAIHTLNASDMNGQVNMTGTWTLTVPAISTTVLPANDYVCLNNEGSGTITLSATPTINPVVTSIPSNTFLCMTSNGTSLDSFGTAIPNFSLTTTGSSGAATLTGNVLNIPQYTGGSGSGTVNSGTQYQLGYYATTGTAISGSSAVTTDSAGDLIVPTATNFVNIGSTTALTNPSGGGSNGAIGAYQSLNGTYNGLIVQNPNTGSSAATTIVLYNGTTDAQVQLLGSSFSSSANKMVFASGKGAGFLTDHNVASGGTDNLTFTTGGYGNQPSLQINGGNPGTVSVGAAAVPSGVEMAVATGVSIGGGSMTFSATAPTVASGFGTSPAIGTGSIATSFDVNVGTGGSATSGVITMPAAAHKWSCDAHDETSNSTMVTNVSAQTTTSITLSNYSRTSGTSTAWNASDVVEVTCAAH